MVVPSPEIVINLPGPMRSYTVKENRIGSMVSEILHYRQKHLSSYYRIRRSPLLDRHIEENRHAFILNETLCLNDNLESCFYNLLS